MTEEFPTSWVLEVCRTCGRKAQWPFCEHRDAPPPADGQGWCTPITVRGKLPDKLRLEEAD